MTRDGVPVYMRDIAKSPTRPDRRSFMRIDSINGIHEVTSSRAPAPSGADEEGSRKINAEIRV